MALTEETLQQIEARTNTASKAPWKMGNYRGVDEDYDLIGPKEPVLRGMIGSKADAEFIVHAREDVPTLIAEIRRLQNITETEDEPDLNHLDEVKADMEWLIRHPGRSMMSTYHDAGKSRKLIDACIEEIRKLRAGEASL